MSRPFWIALAEVENANCHHSVALYFDELSQDAPMLHRARYTASLCRPPHMRPPMSLQYAVLALAATARQEFTHLAMPFYERSRRYADADEMKVSAYPDINERDAILTFRPGPRRILYHHSPYAVLVLTSNLRVTPTYLLSRVCQSVQKYPDGPDARAAPPRQSTTANGPSASTTERSL